MMMNNIKIVLLKCKDDTFYNYKMRESIEK